MTKKRKKVVKMRGSHTHGYGSKKKHRGAGSRGGRGYAGSFKHKKVHLKKKEPEHFQKRKFKSLRGKGLVPTLKTINLRDLKGGEELPGYKVLAAGAVSKGVTIKASAFSEKAKEKIKAAGGSAVEL